MPPIFTTLILLIVMQISAFSKPHPELNKKHIQSQLTTANELFNKQEDLKAIAILEGLVRENPEEAQLHEVLANYYFSQKNYQEAAYYFEKAHNIHQSHPLYALFAAQSYAYLEDWKAVTNLYTIHLQHYPEDAAIWKSLAQVKNKDGNLKGALHAYLKSFNIARSKLDGQDHLIIANLFKAQDNPKKAYEFFTYALQFPNASQEALCNLIRLDVENHNMDKAKTKLSILDGLHPNAIQDYNLEDIHALIYPKQEEPELVDPQPENAITEEEAPKTSQNALDLAFLSEVYLQDNELDKAEEAILEALKIEPDNIKYTFQSLKIAERSKNATEYMAALQAAKEQKPNIPEFTLALARAYRHLLGDVDEATRLYKEFILQFPDHPKTPQAAQELEELLQTPEETPPPAPAS